MKNLLFVFAFLFIAVGTLQAQDVWQWFATDPQRSGPPTTNWLDPRAWYKEPVGHNVGSVPGANDKVKLNNVQWGSNWDQYAPVIGGENGVQNISIGDVFIAEGGAGLSPMHMTVAAGGTFNVIGAGGTAEGQINIAYQAGAVGSFIIDGGTVTVNGPVHVGWGGTGYLSIKSGSVTVDAFDMDGSGGIGYTDIEAGLLIINGFQEPIIQPLIYPPFGGRLTGYGDPANIRVEYNELTDQTIIWAVPEPAGIILFGLAGLILRKRNRR
jgi:hypothetical protein